MNKLKEWTKHYTVRQWILVGIATLMIAASAVLILVTPVTVRLGGIHELTEEFPAGAARSLDLDIDEKTVEAVKTVMEETGLSETLAEIIPDEIGIGLSLGDIKAVCDMYAGTRASITASINSMGDIGTAILGILAEVLLSEELVQGEALVNRLVTAYIILFWVLIALAVLSVIFMAFRKKGAVFFWLVPAAVFTIAWIAASIIGSSLLSEYLSRNLYICFPFGTVAGFLLVLAAAILYSRILKNRIADIDDEASDQTEKLNAVVIDLSNVSYHVPEAWYEGVYQDSTACRSGARSFSMVHETKAEECWLLIHGYRGYPGELVRPAAELYNAGFDVYVPRLPGHGTSGKDFIGSHRSDWVKLAENALEDLKGQYKTVHLLGHSMGTAIAALLGCKDPDVGKIVYVSPSFENLEMKQPARIILKVLSVFTPKVRCKWHLSTKYHQHYENAPCDEAYLGEEYWKWFFTKQLLEYYKLMKDGLQMVSEYPHDQLVINPMKDQIISKPSVMLFREAFQGTARVVDIENGTHAVLYDKDPKAEEKAVCAIMEFAGRLN